MHTGYPNPGLRTVLRHYGELWARFEIPVIVNLLCERLTDLPGMLTTLESIPNVMAIELSLPPQIDSSMLLALARSISGELPVIMRLPLDYINNLLETLAVLGGEYGVAAFSLGPPRGTLPVNPKRLIQGRLYGPGIFPLALSAVQALARLKTPIIGGGGVLLTRTGGGHVGQRRQSRSIRRRPVARPAAGEITLTSPGRSSPAHCWQSQPAYAAPNSPVCVFTP